MYSELVDDICTMIGRSNARTLANVQKYARMTMRESQVLDYFSDDLVEDTITATASPHVWTKPNNLRELRTARYDYYTDHRRWPKLLRPGKVQKDEEAFYYAGTDYYTFAGVDVGQTISIAYYLYFPWLKYYAVADRPAVYDRELNTWTYHANYNSTSELQETARNLVSNWLLRDWAELIQEGTLAKVYKMLREDRMAATSAAIYRDFKISLRTGETSESYGV